MTIGLSNGIFWPNLVTATGLQPSESRFHMMTHPDIDIGAAKKADRSAKNTISTASANDQTASGSYRHRRRLDVS